MKRKQKAKPVFAWAIKNGLGKIELECIYRSKKNCSFYLNERDKWVRVRIEEIDEKPSRSFLFAAKAAIDELRSTPGTNGYIADALEVAIEEVDVDSSEGL